QFLNNEHPSFETHVSRLRREALVPVLIGAKLHRADRGPQEMEELSRTLLILFKPWRSIKDLKSPNETWTEAYSHQDFPSSAKRIISNIFVEHECKDARERIDTERRT
ncbi:hypothetical protein BV25DRAFT_1779127, partial [Artomyces pyxidatus]